MEDVQSQPDHRGIALDRVGVSGVRLPVVAEGQRTVAIADLAVSVPAETKGAHMSRFLEVVEPHRELLSLARLPLLLRDVRAVLEADHAEVAFRFPYFVAKKAPVSKATGWADVEASLEGSLGAELSLTLGAVVPVTSLCPCSKAISDYGAHNQRGYVHLDVTPRIDAQGTAAPLTIADLVRVAEENASAPVYPLLKRPDERHVTMQAYDNPVFVEDIARGVALALREDPRVAAARVRVVNQESIHNHDAFAEVSWTRT
ncbi:MAG: GTP cyclohydrolase FolE2 [Myxococcota bacterium]